jgi:hypothetical protein
MADIPRSAKTKLIAIIVLSVTTFAFGAGFFVFLGLEYFGPNQEVQIPEDVRLIDQDLHVEGTFNRYYNESSKQIYFLIPYAEYYHYRQEVERDIPYQNFIRPNSVRFIAEYIRDNVKDPNNDEMVLMGLLSFVQDRGPNNASMHYVYDSDTSGAKFPLEFFCEGGGDCEDASIAFQSLAQSLGYQTIICFSPQHCFAAVQMDQPPSVNVDYEPFTIEVDGEFYYTVEGTGYGWMLGQLPGSIDPGVISWEPTY